jgi:hypothetical protein
MVNKERGLVCAGTYFREKGVQAVDLLSLLYISVILRNTTQGKLLHKIDLVRSSHAFVLHKKTGQRLVAKAVLVASLP